MTSDCMDDRQGEAMKPSPSPAAMTDDVYKIAEIIDPEAFLNIESADDYPAWWARRQACKFAALQKAEAISSLLASRGTRALTEEEKAKLVPLARVADWGGLRDHNSDQLPVEVIVTYPQGKQSSFLKAANLRAFSELFDRLTGEPSA